MRERGRGGRKEGGRERNEKKEKEKRGKRNGKKEKEIEEKKMGGWEKKRREGGGARQRRLRPRSATRVRATGDGARGQEGEEGKRGGGIRGGRSRRVALDGKEI